MAEGYPLVPEELPTQFKSAMRRLASSVSIVVARGDNGPVGIAATSITSLTVEPPAVLVCVNRAASLHASLVPTAPLNVNLLSRSQKDVSVAFGGGVPPDQRFGVGNWEQAENGLPKLAGAQSSLECVIDSMLAYGTHSIVIARVLRVTLGEGCDPLIYCDGNYL